MSEVLLKVCLVSPVPPPHGGIGRWTTLVHRWIQRTGQVRLSQVDISPRWRAIDDLVVWKRVIGGGLQLVADYLRFLRQVRGAGIVHLTTSGRLATVRDIAICATSRVLGVPVVYHVHFGRVPQIAAAKSLEWHFLAVAAQLADLVLALDTPTALAVKEHLPSVRVEVSPNPIEVPDLPDIPDQDDYGKMVLFLGWLLPTKGVEELLQAWQQCGREGWELVLAGPVNPQYRDELAKRHAAPGVRFLGELSHDLAMQLMARCTVFVLPSHTEGFPYVVLEAMSFGKPVLSTAVGAIPEMLAGGAGMVVRPQDSSALAAALEVLMSDPQARESLGDKALYKVNSSYSLEKVMYSLYDHWNETINKKTA